MTTITDTCGVILRSGPRRGEPCGGNVKEGEETCSRHPVSRNLAHPKKAVVLAAYRMSGNVSFACEAGDIGRRTFYHWLDDDPEFSLAALEARDDAADSLEQEAWRRAYQGTLKPVYQGGKHVGDIREYDTTLTIFLLKALRPAKFRERFDATLTVDTGLPQPSDQPADDTHARLLENLRSARGAIEATSRDHAE